MIRLIVSCEHASPEVPPSFQRLGLGHPELHSHSSWDEGAAVVAKEVAAAFGVFPYLGGWSRVLADLNRSPESEQAIPESSFGLYVPGTIASRRATAPRTPALSPPLSRSRARAVREVIDAGDVCLHLAVHSFTDEIDGTKRDGLAASSTIPITSSKRGSRSACSRR